LDIYITQGRDVISPEEYSQYHFERNRYRVFLCSNWNSLTHARTHVRTHRMSLSVTSSGR